MSNDTAWERHAKLSAMIGKMLLDGSRRIEDINKLHQDFVEGAHWSTRKDTRQDEAVTKKFALLVDLGVITVPDDYVHANRLAKFRHEVSRNHLHYYNADITDKNFPNPTRVLKPGDKLRVQAFKQVVTGGRTTPEECMAFLVAQKALHTGSQGLSLVIEQKHSMLPKGIFVSFDELDRLWKDAGIHGRVPYVDHTHDGKFHFGLTLFVNSWNPKDVFLCFTEVPETKPAVLGESHFGFSTLGTPSTLL